MNAVSLSFTLLFSSGCFVVLQQLDPTIQGSEAAHKEGLEQTLFDRMGKLVRSCVNEDKGARARACVCVCVCVCVQAGVRLHAARDLVAFSCVCV